MHRTKLTDRPRIAPSRQMGRGFPKMLVGWTKAARSLKENVGPFGLALQGY